MKFSAFLRVVPIGVLAVACVATPGLVADDSPRAEAGIATIPETLHVELLEGTTSNLGNTWTAEVTVTIVDSTGHPVVGAVVSVIWDLDEQVELTCDTQQSGRCLFVTEPIRKSVKYATLQVESVAYQGLEYRPDDDHDPDPTTEGTSIRVPKT